MHSFDLMDLVNIYFAIIKSCIDVVKYWKKTYFITSEQDLFSSCLDIAHHAWTLLEHNS